MKQSAEITTGLFTSINKIIIAKTIAVNLNVRLAYGLLAENAGKKNLLVGIIFTT